MTGRRVGPVALWAPAVAVCALLVVWALLDVFRIPDLRAQGGFTIVLAFAMLFVTGGLRIPSSVLRRLGFVLLAAAYFMPHAFWIPLDAAPAIAYVTLFLVFVELRVLASRFAPLFEKDLTPEERAKVRGTLGRAGLRLFGTAATAILLPIFAGDLALAGTVPLTTIPSAVAMAAGLVVVIVLLALLPTWTSRSRPEKPSQAKPN